MRVESFGIAWFRILFEERGHSCRVGLLYCADSAFSIPSLQQVETPLPFFLLERRVCVCVCVSARTVFPDLVMMCRSGSDLDENSASSKPFQSRHRNRGIVRRLVCPVCPVRYEEDDPRNLRLERGVFLLPARSLYCYASPWQARGRLVASDRLKGAGLNSNRNE
mmetsp:Transcript_30337/g.71531  ORF Transcript_30337/g.71531 Transcript_30337/m.71531 type:complete len:165 (-) Transcript_30337:643-1137(-)